MLENFIELPINELVYADWNYKTDDPMLLNKLKNNIKINGQVENLIVRLLETGYYEVINGNHRLQAMNDLNMKTAVCYNFGNISEEMAKRIAIETNETRFDTDQVKLASIINDLLEEYDFDELEETLPYSHDELENFEKLSELDFDEFFEELPEGTDNIIEKPEKKEGESIEIACPHCQEKMWLRDNKVIAVN